MQSTTIKTGAGDLKLVPATINRLRGLAHYWPMELILDIDGPGRYGLVFQQDEEEVKGIKMQTVDVAKADAIRNHHVYRVVIAAAL